MTADNICRPSVSVDTFSARVFRPYKQLSSTLWTQVDILPTRRDKTVVFSRVGRSEFSRRQSAGIGNSLNNQPTNHYCRVWIRRFKTVADKNVKKWTRSQYLSYLNRWLRRDKTPHFRRVGSDCVNSALDTIFASTLPSSAPIHHPNDIYVQTESSHYSICNAVTRFTTFHNF